MFLNSQPVKIEFINDDKVIALTKKKLIFMNLSMMESSVEIPLVGVDPQNFFFNPYQLEVLVQTVSTIEIYSCDWKTQIQLKRVITLNKKSVSWVSFDEQGWNIYGSQQEDKTKVFFYPVKSYTDDALAQCYVQDKQYLITSQFLYKSEQMNERRPIKFTHHQAILKNKSKITMSATNESDYLDILCINVRYVLLVNEYTILKSFQFGNILLSEYGLLVSGRENDDTVNFHYVQKESVFDFGNFRKGRGKIMTSKVCSQEFTLLTYRNRQLTKEVFYIGEQRSQNVANLLPSQSQSSKASKTHQKNIPEFIAQHAQQEMSPIQVRKPKIKDIPSFDGQQELCRDMFQNNQSDVLSQTGNELRKKIILQERDKIYPYYIESESQKRDDQLREDSVEGRAFPDKVNSLQDQTQHLDEQQNNGLPKTAFRVKKSRSEIKNGRIIPREINIKSYQCRQKISDSSSSKFDSVPETPAFGEDKFEYFPSNLIPPKVEQVEQIEESFALPQSESINKSYMLEQSAKVRAFTPQDSKLTTSLAREIQKTSYIKLMSRLQRTDEQKFEELMKQFLWEIAKQKNSSIFFANHIKVLEDETLKQKIQKMFNPYIDQFQAKSILTSALKQFKLNQVPLYFLNFDSKFLYVLTQICPDLYISDICQPTSQGTLKYILDYYFERKSEYKKKIRIEDEQIDISHPRNMLNVLFYLNDSFHLKFSDVLKVYFEKIVNEKCWGVIKSLKKMKIFEIVGEPEQILDFIMIDYLESELLSGASLEQLNKLWEVIELINQKVFGEYQMKLAIIRELQNSYLKFNRASILYLRKKKEALDIFNFLQSLIKGNSSSSLVNIKLAHLYRCLYWLEEGEKIKNCTFQYVDLVKILAEKLLSDEYIFDAFQLLFSVHRKLRKSYFVEISLLYLNGAFLHMIACEQQEYFNIKIVFEKIFMDPSITLNQIKPEKCSKPEKSKYFSCPWETFLNNIKKFLEVQSGLCFLIYLDLPTANLFFSNSHDHVLKRKFLDFTENMQEYIDQSSIQPISSEDSNNPKALTNILFFSEDQFYESQNLSCQQRVEQNLLQDNLSDKKKQVFQSMALIDHLQNVQTFSKANSESKSSTKKKKKKNIFEECEDDDLRRLKFLVDRDEIISQLEQIYHTKSKVLFLKALSIIDQQKITLYNVESFRLLVAQKINLQFQVLIPFKAFIYNDKDALFRIIKKKIGQLITIDNFWLITKIIDLFYGKRKQVYHIFLIKIIHYYRNDQLFPIVRFLLSEVSPLEFAQKKDLLNFSFNRSMNKIYDLLQTQ